MAQRQKKTSQGFTKRLLKSRLLILALIILLAAGGIFIIERNSKDPAATLSRQLADQYLEGIENCDYDKFLHAKAHNLYKAGGEAPKNEWEEKQFRKECGTIKVVRFLKEKVVTQRISDKLATRSLDYMVNQTKPGEETKTMIMRLATTGNEKDGFKVEPLGLLTQEEYEDIRVQ